MDQRVRRLFSTTHLHYSAAILSVLLTALVRNSLGGILHDELPLFVFIIPIAFSSWLGGLGPGLVTTILALLVTDDLFFSFQTGAPTDEATFRATRVAALAAAGAVCSILFDRIQKHAEPDGDWIDAFRRFVQGAPDFSLVTLDARGRIVAAPPAGNRRPDPLAGQHLSILYTPEDVQRDKPNRDLAVAAAEGRFAEEGWRVRDDGSRYWANTVITVTRNRQGQLRGFIMVTHDLSGRKRGGGQVSREEKQSLQQILDVVPNVIYIFDVSQRKLIFVSGGVLSALGYAPEQALQGVEFLRSVMHPSDWQDLVEPDLAQFNNLSVDESTDFEYRVRHSNGSWRWFQLRNRVYKRNETGEILQIIGVATNIDERKKAEERTRFVSRLDEAIRPLADPEEIMAVALRMLGEHLDVNRCGYAEVKEDEDHFVVLGDYVRGNTRSIVGRFPMSDFEPRELQVLQSGRPYVVNDIVAESSPGTDLSLYELGDVRSMVCVPLTKDGRFAARMAVHQSTPRQWTQEEVKLVATVANHCWESVARARALRSLKESDDRYRAFLANSSESIWRLELEQPIPLDLPENQQIDMLYQFGYLAECNVATARTFGYDSVDRVLGSRLNDLIPRSARSVAFLRAGSRAGYRVTDFETRRVEADGTIRYFVNNTTGIRNNGVLLRIWGTQREITEEKAALDAVRASEERLRRITEATQDALWQIDLRTRQLWWSEGAKPLFGRSPTELQIGLEDWYRGIHPEDVDRVRKKFDGFMAGAESNWDDQYRFRRADGQYIYIQDQGRKFYESGSPVFISGAMVDITKRKLDETALRESEERFRLLTELSPDGVVITDTNAAIQLANPSMLSMLELQKGEAIGRNLFEFISAEDQDHCRECMQKLTNGRGQSAQMEATFLRVSGHAFPVEVNGKAFPWKEQQLIQIVVHDNSLHKQAEAERNRLLAGIEAERTRLQQILEQMPVGIVIVDAPSGGLLFHNLEAERLVRHPLPRSRDYKDFAHSGGVHLNGTPYQPEEYPITRSLFEQQVIKGEEMRYRRGDSTETFFSVDSAPIYDSEGRIVLAVATFFDIAERKRAEEQLRESEERFAKAFRASPDSLVISRIADGVIIEVNDRFAALTGYPAEELIGKSTLQLGLYEDPSFRATAVSLLEKQGFIRDLELPMKLKSGEIRFLSFSAEPLELRGERCWLTIGRDITDSKQAEMARVKSEEEARRQLAYVEAIYAAAPVGLGFVDTELRFRSINERLAELNGQSVENHLGRTIREAMPSIADAVEPHYHYVIQTGKPVLNVELSAASPLGRTQHFIVNYYPIKNDIGRVLGVNVVVIDITQRKQAEEERERLLIKEKSAREDAETANRLKDEFLATISHELRTPLTSILGWARMLDGDSLSEAQRNHAVEVIIQNAKSQGRLIDDILDTSRIIAGRLKLDCQLVEIEQVFQAAVDIVKPSAEAKKIALHVVVDQGGKVFGDPNRLQQAIWNVLSNAVKFTSEGGRIEARLSRKGTSIEITVSDTGIGIEPEFLPYAFDRFRQADSTSTRKYGGLGLGLAVVRHLVEMHGGSVSADSPGRNMGSTFNLELPMASDNLVTLTKPTPKTEPSGEGRHDSLVPYENLNQIRLLIVDDDPDTLSMLEFVLKDHGATVATAASTAEALKVMDRWRPDVLVSDIAMPDQDGYALISQVRRKTAEQGGNVPAVALTAYARPEDRVRALASGFQMYLPKPVEPKELIAVVASLSHRKAS